MSNMKNYFFVLFLILFLFACKEEPVDESITPIEAYEFLRTIGGEWAIQPTERAIEIWLNTEDNITGQGISISEDGDSSHTEVYFLEMINDSLRLEVLPVSESGYSLPIQYFLTNATADTLVFENPEHTFPKIMTYVFSDDEYQVLLKGDIDGVDMNSELVYKKKAK